MNKIGLLILILVGLTGGCSTNHAKRSVAEAQANSSLSLPITPENFTNPDDPNVRAWVTSQSQRTKDLLYSSPVFTQLANVGSYYPTNPSINRLDLGDREISLIFDVSSLGGRLTLSRPGQPDLTLVNSPPAGWAIGAAFQVSPNGRYLLYSISQGDQDTAEWSVYDMEKQQPLSDAPTAIRILSINWAQNSNGFYYSKWYDSQWPDPKLENPSPNLSHQVPTYYHQLGTPSSSDAKVFSSPEKRQATSWSIQENESGDRLMAIRNGTLSSDAFAETRLWIYAGEKPKNGFSGAAVSPVSWDNVRMIGNTLGRYLTTVGNEAILRSSECGDGFCLVAVSMLPPYATRVLVPASKQLVMEQPVRSGNYFVIPYHDRKQMNERLRIYSLDGKLVSEFIPSKFGQLDQGSLGIGYVHNLSKKFYFQYSDFYNLFTYSFDAENGFQQLPQTKPSALQGAKNIETHFQFVRSFDGVKVPVWTMSRNDLNAPPKFLFVYAYGGIGDNTLPFMEPEFLMALELGGMGVLVSARGGEELGAHWYLDGVQDAEMRPVKDIVWATRWAKKAYHVEQAALSGLSFGGMHTYLAYTYYSDDFDVFFPNVGLTTIPPTLNSPIIGLLLDDFGAHRDSQGDVTNYDELVKRAESWSPLAKLPELAHPKPLLSFAETYDGRGGPQQVYFIQSALLNRFGADAPYYMIEFPHGHGDDVSSDSVLELTFLAHQFHLTTIYPLIQQGPASTPAAGK